MPGSWIVQCMVLASVSCGETGRLENTVMADPASRLQGWSYLFKFFFFFFSCEVELASEFSGLWDVPCFRQLAEGSLQPGLPSWEPQPMWIERDVSESRNNTAGCRAFPPCCMQSRNTMHCLSGALRACWRVGWGVKIHLQGIKKIYGADM